MVKIPCARDMHLADISEDWRNDCLRWRGAILTGNFAHWCWDWDFLPVDDTTSEFEACHCFD